MMNENLTVANHFCCPIYLIEKPEFLDSVNEVSEEYLKESHSRGEMHEIYPVMMTKNYFDDTRIEEFTRFVGQSSWNILSEQGYDMDNRLVSFTEMWTQEHHKHSLMEQHTHGYGSQIIGFYFLEVPEDSSRVVFHDPRAGKIQIDLPEKDEFSATIASKAINFEPKPGLLLFANSWLAHSFTRHVSDKPLKFVHFNLNILEAQQNYAVESEAEVI